MPRRQTNNSQKYEHFNMQKTADSDQQGLDLSFVMIAKKIKIMNPSEIVDKILEDYDEEVIMNYNEVMEEINKPR